MPKSWRPNAQQSEESPRPWLTNFKVAKRLDLNSSNLYFLKVDVANVRRASGETQRQRDPRKLVHGSGTVVVAQETRAGGSWRAPELNKPGQFSPPGKTASSLLALGILL